MKNYGFGVDVGGTTCKIGFFENSGNMLDKWEIKTNTENHGASILDDIVASLESKLADAGICKDEVEGVGIGVPGTVKNDSVVCECVNLGWGTFDVAETQMCIRDRASAKHYSQMIPLTAFHPKRSVHQIRISWL